MDLRAALFTPFPRTLLGALAMLLGLSACDGAQQDANKPDPSTETIQAGMDPVAGPNAAAEEPLQDEAPAGDGLTAEAPAKEAPLPEDILARDAPAGRLPEGVRPAAYDLALTIDPRQERFFGQVAIEVERDNAGEGFWFHGSGLDVSQVVIAGPDGQEQDGTYRQVLSSGVAWVGFAEALPAGPLTVTLTYSAPFDTNLAGLFRVEEQGEAYALAKSESIQARKYLPGFDEPGLKAPFTVTLIVPEGYEAIGNTPILLREPVQTDEGGAPMERVRFAPTRPLSTFLLSLAVGPFDVVERAPLPPTAVRDRAVPLRGFARKGKGAELTLILDITRDFVEAFENALGLPYPYQKLDIVAAPQWPSGATELAGAITYREQRILLGPNPPPAARRAMLSVHAHEIAHMWFGNLVTPPWWDDLWLKEGFATWGTPLVLEQWEPEGGHGLDATARALGAMKRDALKNARAVREPIAINENVRNAYTPIPYSKGMALIRMMEGYFGTESFRQALGRYIEIYTDGAADSDAFFKTIGEVTGVPALTTSFRSFVDQSGVPLIDAALDCSGEVARVRLRQSRYRPAGSAIEPGRRWTVPVCVRTPDGDGGSAKTCTLLEETMATVDLETPACPAWLMPNAAGTGYYRWSLPAEGWSALAGEMDRLDPNEALSTVSGAIASFEAETGGSEPPLGAATLAAILKRSAGASERRVVEAGLQGLSHLIRTAGEDPAAQTLRRFARGLYEPRLAGLDDPQTENDVLLRTDLERFLALSARTDQVRADLARAAAAFIGFGSERDAAALTSDEYTTALTVGVQELGALYVDALIEARESIDDPRFDGSSAKALGRLADEVGAAAKVRDYALSGTPGPREAYSMIEGLLDEPATRAMSWRWFKNNIETITAIVPAQWRRRLPLLTAGFCEADQLTDVEMFFTENAALMPGLERQLDQSLESIALCVARKARLTAADLSAFTLPRTTKPQLDPAADPGADPESGPGADPEPTPDQN